jgi:geranylgeranyl pyrophosphate synthase
LSKGSTKKDGHRRGVNVNKTISQEEVTEQIIKILHERGKKGLELAKKTIFEEKFESEDVKEAIEYFMTEFWQDFFRPAYLSLCCESVGGNPDITTSISISLSLISGALALHDDIIDKSKIKHSKPTVLKKFDKNITLLVGDILMVKGFTLLFKAVDKGVTAKQISVISEIMNKTFLELGDAEALQLKFRGRTDVTPEDYLHVVRKKASDSEGFARIGALVGGGSVEEIEALGEYGRLVGMMAILRSDTIDLLDLKKAINRIKNEPLPLTILYALQKPEMQPIIKALLKKIKTQKDIKKLIKSVYIAGGFIQMEKCMNKLANEAYIQLHKMRYNKNILQIFVRGQLIPEWSIYLP